MVLLLHRCRFWRFQCRLGPVFARGHQQSSTPNPESLVFNIPSRRLTVIFTPALSTCCGFVRVKRRRRSSSIFPGVMQTEEWVVTSSPHKAGEPIIQEVPQMGLLDAPPHVFSHMKPQSSSLATLLLLLLPYTYSWQSWVMTMLCMVAFLNANIKPGNSRKLNLTLRQFLRWTNKKSQS